MNRKEGYVSKYYRPPRITIRGRLIKAVPYVTWGTIVAIYLFCLYKFALSWIAENGMPHTVLGAIATFGMIFCLPTAFIFMFLAGEKLIGFHPIEDLLYWLLGHKQPAARNPNTSGTDSDAAHRAFMQGVAVGRASGRRSGL